MSLPHTLTLALVDEPFDPAAPLAWNTATLTCPHQPPTTDMDCATLDRCGCPENPAESYNGEGPCPNSPTGRHTYLPDWDDDPACPQPRCWAATHDHLQDSAQDLDAGPGTYKVWPACEDFGQLTLLRTDPDVARARAAEAVR